MRAEVQGHRDDQKMDEVVVKQGYLHLQQQQTFGKVGAWAGAGPRGWRAVRNS